MEALKKFETRLTNEIIECLLMEDSIKNDLNNFLDVKINTEDVSCIRRTVLNRFKQMMEESTNDLCKEDNLDQKFSTLKSLSNNFKENIGWRPSGLPIIDSYGPRKSLIQKYIKDLEELKLKLETRTKVI